MDKEKLKDLIFTSSVTLLLGGLVALGTFGCHQLSKVSAEEEEQPLLTQPFRVAYDDNTKTISLTADEVENYTFNNFYNRLKEDVDDANNSIVLTYNLSQANSNGIYDGEGGFEYYGFEISNNIWILLQDVNDNYYFKIYQNNTFTDLTSAITLNDDIYYSSLKEAIELDIQANQSSSDFDYLDLMEEIISLLTGGLVTTATALGSGISAYVGSILVSGTSMSAFASVIFIFGGIALAFTLGRWVLNFITSLGNRNR